MRSTLRGLFAGIIDFAGLFPPARQNMVDALQSFQAWKAGEDQWIVDRFVCPSNRLIELADSINRLEIKQPFAVSVIGAGGSDLATFENGLEQDAKSMSAFEKEMEDRCTIEAFEVRAPSGKDLAPALRDLGAFNQIETYVELPFDDAIADGLALIAENGELYAKGRTGGIDAQSFPSAASLAEFLANAVDLALPFKLTAGLHEPIRHFDNSIGVFHHGFVNVLAAVAARDFDHASTGELSGILGLETEEEFKLEDTSLTVGERSFQVRELEDLRTLFVGFGSCSVSEPLAGLARLSHPEAIR